jgi:hypothetical protein
VAFPYAHAALARLETAQAAPGYEARAIAHLEAAIARLPESGRFHYDLGACRAGAGDAAGAHAAFQAALAAPRLAPPPGAAGHVLAAEFHGDPEALAALIANYYDRIL